MAFFDIRFKDGSLLASLPTPAAKGLTLVNKDGTSLNFGERPEKSITLPILGSGHFGVVIRAADSLGLRRAVKFIDTSKLPPKGATRRRESDTSSAQLVADLTSEIRTTNVRLFKHIVPVVDCAAVRDSEGKLVPYTVSPYVDGPLLDEYFSTLLSEAMKRKRAAALNALHDLFLDIVDDLLGALVEMEEGRVSHIDLKPSNIIVQRAGLSHPNVRDQAFVIDFAGAVSHQPQPSGSRVPMMNTPWYFPGGDVGADCVRDNEGKADHASLVKWGPLIDRHCIGRTLESVILDVAHTNTTQSFDDNYRRQQARKEQEWRTVLDDDSNLIAGLVGRLKADSVERFVSAPEARRAFQAIARHNSSNVLASRALTDRTKGIVINVGVRSVKIAPPFDRIVNHAAMQRLRRLQQLALISDVFPAATHSRFTHVLATFGLAKEYLLALNRDSEFRLLCSHRDVEQILAAALLHDLGQYAFSHTIEDLKKLGDNYGIESLRGIKHDQQLVKDYIDIEDDGVSIRQILEDSELDVSRVMYMLDKTAKQPAYGPACSIGRDIVSGVIDADRISYLVQDSKTSGTSFGDAINVDQLVESLCVMRDGVNVSLAIRESGVSAVEAVLAAVYWMYRNVYWHPLNRGMMAAVKHVFWDLLEHGGMSFDDYSKAVYGKTERQALRYLSDRYEHLVSANTGWRNPIDSIARGLRSSMIRVWSVGGVASVPNGEVAQDVYRGVYRKLSRDFFKTVIKNIVEALPASVSPQRGEILIDVPMKKRIVESNQGAATALQETETELGRREPLWVQLQSARSPGRWRLLEEHTPLVRALAQAEDVSARKVRVFFSKDLLNRCKQQYAGDLWALVGESVRKVVTPPESQ